MYNNNFTSSLFFSMISFFISDSWDEELRRDTNTFKQPVTSSIILQQYSNQYYIVTNLINNVWLVYTHSGMYIYV